MRHLSMHIQRSGDCLSCKGLCSQSKLWFQVPVTVVLGKPIACPQIDDPTEVEIHKYLQLYIAATESICLRYTAQAGYPDTVF